jgi:ribosomal protein L21
VLYGVNLVEKGVQTVAKSAVAKAVAKPFVDTAKIVASPLVSTAKKAVKVAKATQRKARHFHEGVVR